MKKVIFVCLGNICRSPAAEAVFREMVSKRAISSEFFIDSAGTYGGHQGEKADCRMRRAAQSRNYNITSISRQFRRADFDNFDLVVAMDNRNRDDLSDLAMSLDHQDKIVTMASFSSDPNVSYVPDPYYGGAQGFDNVLDILEDCCANLLQKLT